MRKYKIGITFNLETNSPDIWSNGANQNIIFLYDLFKRSAIVEDVVLVCWGITNTTTPPKGFMLDDLELKFAYINDVIDELDVLINRPDGYLMAQPSIVCGLFRKTIILVVAIFQLCMIARRKWCRRFGHRLSAIR